MEIRLNSKLFFRNSLSGGRWSEQGLHELKLLCAKVYFGRAWTCSQLRRSTRQVSPEQCQSVLSWQPVALSDLLLQSCYEQHFQTLGFQMFGGMKRRESRKKMCYQLLSQNFPGVPLFPSSPLWMKRTQGSCAVGWLQPSSLCSSDCMEMELLFATLFLLAC